MNKPKIIFFDVDGTLVPLKGAARPRTLEALRRLHQNCIRLCIATGRAPMEVPKFEGVSFDAFLTYNGSYCFTPEQDIFKNTIPTEEVATLIRNAAALGRPVALANTTRLAANGSDEVLAFAFRAFCGAGRPVAYADITYGFYKSQAALFGLDVKVIPLREDFSLAVEDYLDFPGTIVIANPNAPTTLLQPVAAIEEVVRTNPDSIVIVDEAYIDFAGPNASCVPLTKKYDNVIVVQTFSKSHNLAGARVGFCVANPELIADMNRIKFSYSPYNVNSLSQAAAVAAMEDENYFRDTVGKICATRADTMTKLRERGFTGPDSATNFLFVTTSRMPCKQIFERLRQKGVLIRYFSAPRLSDYLRITIGTPEQMQRFFEELDLILG